MLRYVAPGRAAWGYQQHLPHGAEAGLEPAFCVPRIPKGTLVTTTIGKLVGRRSDACGDEGLEETLAHAQRVFADVRDFLEHEIDRLWASDCEDGDEDRLRAVRELVLKNQAALRTVLEIETKLGLRKADGLAQAIDLEEARAEIERRLARLADDG